MTAIARRRPGMRKWGQRAAPVTFGKAAMEDWMMARSDPELAGILRNMDGRISNLEGQVQGIDARLLGLEEGQRELGRRIDRIFYALIGLGGAVIGILGGGLITLIVRGAGG